MRFARGIGRRCKKGGGAQFNLPSVSAVPPRTKKTKRKQTVHGEGLADWQPLFRWKKGGKPGRVPKTRPVGHGGAGKSDEEKENGKKKKKGALLGTCRSVWQLHLTRTGGKRQTRKGKAR